jgi:hypothetical protein
VDLGQLALTTGGKAAYAKLKPAVSAAKEVGKVLTPKWIEQAVLTPFKVPEWVGLATAVIIAKSTGTSEIAVRETARIFRAATDDKIIDARDAWRRGTERVDSAGLVELTTSAVEELRSKRAREYSKKLDSLGLADKPLSVEGLRQTFDEIQDKFEFDMDLPANERYTDSTLWGETDTGHLSMSLEKVKTFLDGVSGKSDDVIYTVDDLTNGKAMDKLKKQLDNRLEMMKDDAIGTPSRSKLAISKLRYSIKEELGKIDGYDDLCKEYEQATGLLKGLDETLSFDVLNKVSQDESLKKVLSILESDREYGRQLMSKLEEQTQTPLFAEIVGAQFADDWPSTITGPRMGRGEKGILAMIAALATAPLARPKLWGELLRAIPGIGGRRADEMVDWGVRHRGQLVAVARDLRRARRHEEQTAPGFQQQVINPMLDKVTNPQQRSALQQVANQGVRANRDVDRLLESFTRSPKY